MALELVVAAGFEIGAVGALEFAFLLAQACPAIRAGSFYFFEIRAGHFLVHSQPLITYADRLAACRPVVLFQNTRPGDRGWLPRLQAFLRKS